jgi:excisionase family DNA binding protein
VVSEPHQAEAPKSQWFTLGEASQFLGVHPTTLREWVDAGMLQVFRTPGGHRRFDLRDLERFLQQRKTITPSRALAIAERNPLDDIRRQLDASQIARQRWYRQLTDEQRAREREMGQRMLGLLIQYASRYENAEHFLKSARVLSRAHGRDAARMGLSPSNVVRVCLFFRRAILNATHQPQDANAPNDAEGMRLYQRINEFMDEMLLSALEAYEEARRHTPLK